MSLEETSKKYYQKALSVINLLRLPGKRELRTRESMKSSLEQNLFMMINVNPDP